MRRLVFIGVMLWLLAAMPNVDAQGCGDDPLNPCGSLPWDIVRFPPLASPTVYQLRPTPTPVPVTGTPTPTPTVTQTPTITPTIPDYSGDQDSAATLAAQSGDAFATLSAATPAAARGMEAATAAAVVGGYAETFIGYAKGLQLFDLTGLGGLVGFLLGALVFIVVIQLSTAILPAMAAIVRWVIRLLQLIGEFLPL